MKERTCSFCGRKAKHGYLWDGTDFFCTRRCIDKALTHTTVSIMLDDQQERRIVRI